MEKKLHLLETFNARGSDGRIYEVRGYEHLARIDGVPIMLAQWEPTGLAEYKLADGRHVSVHKNGAMTLEDSGVTLEREPSRAAQTAGSATA